MPFDSEMIADLATSLRADLASYTPDAVAELLGTAAYDAYLREQRTPALAVARAHDSTLAVHIRAFLLGDTLNHDDITRAFPTLTERALTHILFDDDATARFQIVPVATPSHLHQFKETHDHILIASDWGEIAGYTPRSEHVMPVGGASKSLMALASYSFAQRVADIGTGCGIHAICAALAGAQVTATDISERALAYARLNAALAEVEIDFRRGSLLEPLLGERFDVVVSNPPFVITPESVRQQAHYTYRDGGQAGDTLLGDMLGGLHRVLKAGGRAYMLGNWEIAEGCEWDARLREWTDGLEAWVIEREELTPERYCEMWLRDGGLTVRDSDYEETYRLWRDDFVSRGVTAIGMGFFILGKPEAGDTRPLQRFERLSGALPPAKELNAYIERVWNNRVLIDMSDDELAILRLRTTHAIEQRLYMPGQGEPFLIKLSQLEGFGEEIQLTTEGAAALGACDGDLTLGQISDAVCDVLDIHREGDGPLLAGLGELVRTAAGLGMLTL